MPSNIKPKGFLHAEEGHSLLESIVAITLLNLLVLIVLQALIGQQDAGGKSALDRALYQACREIDLSHNMDHRGEEEIILSESYILRRREEISVSLCYRHWEIIHRKTDLRMFRFHSIENTGNRNNE